MCSNHSTPYLNMFGLWEGKDTDVLAQGACQICCVCVSGDLLLYYMCVVYKSLCVYIHKCMCAVFECVFVVTVAMRSEHCTCENSLPDFVLWERHTRMHARTYEWTRKHAGTHMQTHITFAFSSRYGAENQSVSGGTTICLMQCNTSPSHRIDQAVDLWPVECCPNQILFFTWAEYNLTMKCLLKKCKVTQ
jgi:hypothetical protein